MLAVYQKIMSEKSKFDFLSESENDLVSTTGGLTL
jgi:hypothetical protein